MLFIALAATLCGAKNTVDIANFGKANEPMLAEVVDLPHGAPSHDSFSRVFRLLDPAELASTLARFAQEVRAALGLDTRKEAVAIDAESLRHGRERGGAVVLRLLASVWDAATRQAIATRRAAGGEVEATLAVLKSLVLAGCNPLSNSASNAQATRK